MNDLKVVEFIKNNGLDALEKQFFIHVKRHGKYPNLVLLKYDQINSDFSQEMVRQCRGIILDETNDWKVVCYSYCKFANYGESYADKIDWENANVLAKEDGSLCQLFFYDNKWHVATSGDPSAGGQVNGFDYTFSELFWKVWNELGYILPDKQDNNKCYSFELLTPYNRIVVKHKVNRIVLHGIRNLSDLEQFLPNKINSNNWEIIKYFQINSIEEAIDKANNFNGLENEGFVIVDSVNFNRIKVKGKHYLTLAYLKESCGSSQRRLLELVRINEGVEFLTSFSEFSNDYYKIKFKYDILIKQIDSSYKMIEHISDRKIFASLATKNKYSGLLFNMKDKKINSFKEGLKDINIKVLEEWLDL